RARWRPRRRPGLALAGGLGVLALAIAVAPTWVAAQALRRMEAAVADVQSAHLIDWQLGPDGGRTERMETGEQRGRWRLEGRGRVQVFADGRLWSYEPDANRVTVRRRAGPFGHNPSGFSIGAMARDFARWGWRDRLRAPGVTTWNGRQVREVIID